MTNLSQSNTYGATENGWRGISMSDGVTQRRSVYNSSGPYSTVHSMTSCSTVHSMTPYNSLHCRSRRCKHLLSRSVCATLSGHLTAVVGCRWKNIMFICIAMCVYCISPLLPHSFWVGQFQCRAVYILQSESRKNKMIRPLVKSVLVYP